MLAAETLLMLVFSGIMMAFTLLTGVAVIMGTRLVARAPMKWLRIGMSAVFMAMGVVSIMCAISEISIL